MPKMIHAVRLTLVPAALALSIGACDVDSRTGQSAGRGAAVGAASGAVYGLFTGDFLASTASGAAAGAAGGFVADQLSR